MGPGLSSSLRKHQLENEEIEDVGGGERDTTDDENKLRNIQRCQLASKSPQRVCRESIPVHSPSPIPVHSPSPIPFPQPRSLKGASSRGCATEDGLTHHTPAVPVADSPSATPYRAHAFYGRQVEIEILMIAVRATTSLGPNDFVIKWRS